VEPATTATFVAVASAPAVKKALELLVAELHQVTKSTFGDRMKRWATTHHLEDIRKNLRTLRMVKTI